MVGYFTFARASLVFHTFFWILRFCIASLSFLRVLHTCILLTCLAKSSEQYQRRHFRKTSLRLQESASAWPLCRQTRKKDSSSFRNLKIPSRPDILNKNRLHTRTLDTLNFISRDEEHWEVILLNEIHKNVFLPTVFNDFSVAKSDFLKLFLKGELLPYTMTWLFF